MSIPWQVTGISYMAGRLPLGAAGHLPLAVAASTKHACPWPSGTTQRQSVALPLELVLGGAGGLLGHAEEAACSSQDEPQGQPNNECASELTSACASSARWARQRQRSRPRPRQPWHRRRQAPAPRGTKPHCCPAENFQAGFPN